MSIESESDGIKHEEMPDGSTRIQYPESDTYYILHPDGTKTVYYESGTIIMYDGLRIVELTSAAEGIEGVTFVPVCGGWVEKDPEDGRRRIVDTRGNIILVTA
jgi:hypothetical protein